jgi:hypothetical protein
MKIEYKMFTNNFPAFRPATNMYIEAIITCFILHIRLDVQGKTHIQYQIANSVAIDKFV